MTTIKMVTTGTMVPMIFVLIEIFVLLFFLEGFKDVSVFALFFIGGHLFS